MAAKLLKQLTFPLDRLHTTIASLSDYKQKDERPELPVLIKMLTECATKYTAVSVILDAFDECFEPQQRRVAAYLLKPLYDVGIGLHITTRYSCVEVLKSVLTDASVEEMRADCDDIKNYLEKQIQESGKGINESFKATLIEKISGRADGM